MPDWKMDFRFLITDAELALRYYLKTREAHLDAEMKLGLALRKLQEHYKRNPRQVKIEPLCQEKLRDLLSWMECFDRDKTLQKRHGNAALE